MGNRICRLAFLGKVDFSGVFDCSVLDDLALTLFLATNSIPKFRYHMRKELLILIQYYCLRNERCFACTWHLVISKWFTFSAVKSLLETILFFLPFPTRWRNNNLLHAHILTGQHIFLKFGNCSTLFLAHSRFLRILCHFQIIAGRIELLAACIVVKLSVLISKTFDFASLFRRFKTRC